MFLLLVKLYYIHGNDSLDYDDGVECPIINQEEYFWRSDEAYTKPILSKQLCMLNSATNISEAGLFFSNAENDDVRMFVAEDAEGIEFLPINIAETFPNLIFIRIERCSLQYLNSLSFHKLHGLLRLQVQENLVESIDKNTFDDLRNLLDLSLSSNLISYLHPKTFVNLLKLRLLELDYNRLASFEPRLIQVNKKLMTLDISSNRLQFLKPGTFETLTSLKNLRARNNRISVLPSTICSNCKRLKLLDLHGNNITEIPLGYLSHLSELREIIFSSNPLTSANFALFVNNKLITSIEFSGIPEITVKNIEKIDQLSKLEFVGLYGHVCLEDAYGTFIKNHTLADLKTDVKITCDKDFRKILEKLHKPSKPLQNIKIGSGIAISAANETPKNLTATTTKKPGTMRNMLDVVSGVKAFPIDNAISATEVTETTFIDTKSNEIVNETSYEVDYTTKLSPIREIKKLLNKH